MIRVATHSDIPRIVELGRLMHAESAYAPIEFNDDKVSAFMASLIDGGGVVFLSDIDGHVVGGFAGGITEHFFSTDKVAFDYSFFIAPEARHGASAVRLMMAFCEWAKLRGAKRINIGITTGVHVETTSKFYRKCGFHDAGVFFQKEI